MNGDEIATAEDWFEKRRPELKLLFQHYMYGYFPSPPDDIKLPPRDCYHEAVPMMDNENPPARISRDAPILLAIS